MSLRQACPRHSACGFGAAAAAVLVLVAYAWHPPHSSGPHSDCRRGVVHGVAGRAGRRKRHAAKVLLLLRQPSHGHRRGTHPHPPRLTLHHLHTHHAPHSPRTPQTPALPGVLHPAGRTSTSTSTTPRARARRVTGARFLFLFFFCTAPPSTQASSLAANHFFPIAHCTMLPSPQVQTKRVLTRTWCLYPIGVGTVRVSLLAANRLRCRRRIPVPSSSSGHCAGESPSVRACLPVALGALSQCRAPPWRWVRAKQRPGNGICLCS